MFEHDFERDIATIIIDNYNKNKKVCERDASMYHAIGVSFSQLLKKLGIDVEITYKNEEIHLISHSQLLNESISGEDGDVSLLISEEQNKNELLVVQFMQTVSFLKELENHNYIVIYSRKNACNGPTHQIYESYKITNVKLVQFINELKISRIIPTTALIEISTHKYKTVDQRRYERQLKDNKKALKEARKANKLTAKSISKTKKWNLAAISVAIATMCISIWVGCRETKLDHTSIHEIGREIHLNTYSPFLPTINIYYKQEKDSTINGKIKNEKP